MQSTPAVTFPFLLTLAPFVSFADTLAKGKASHTLLQHRFAPRKVVRLLPDKRGQLKDLHSLFYIRNHFIPLKKCNSLLPSFLIDQQNRNDDRRKNII